MVRDARYTIVNFGFSFLPPRTVFFCRKLSVSFGAAPDPFPCPHSTGVWHLSHRLLHDLCSSGPETTDECKHDEFESMKY